MSSAPLSMVRRVISLGRGTGFLLWSSIVQFNAIVVVDNET